MRRSDSTSHHGTDRGTPERTGGVLARAQPVSVHQRSPSALATVTVTPFCDAQARRSRYEKPCLQCGTAYSCPVCRACAQCESCTATAMCGSCRGKHSRARAASSGSKGSVQRVRCRAAVPAELSAAEASGYVSLPRSRAGLHACFDLLAASSPALECAPPRRPSSRPSGQISRPLPRAGGEGPVG